MAADEFGLDATGITLSQEQYDYTQAQIKQRHLEEKVHVQLKDYREVTGQFDYVTSVGMFEHVGKENLGLYFNKIQAFLVPGGRALIMALQVNMKVPALIHLLTNIFSQGLYPKCC